jgi:hypothetical protein
MKFGVFAKGTSFSCTKIRCCSTLPYRNFLERFGALQLDSVCTIFSRAFLSLSIANPSVFAVEILTDSVSSLSQPFILTSR